MIAPILVSEREHRLAVLRVCELMVQALECQCCQGGLHPFPAGSMMPAEIPTFTTIFVRRTA